MRIRGKQRLLSLEDMSRSLEPNLVDITLSNAVFEHLFDVPAAYRQLARLMSPGAYGIHQIDHRDHRDFTRPWEFLLLSESEFRQMFQDRHGECGNRTPLDTMVSIFKTSGFDITGAVKICLRTIAISMILCLV